MTTLRIYCFGLFVFLTLALPVARSGHAAPDVPASMKWDFFRSADPEKPVLAVFFLTPDPGWHVYGNKPGPTGIPTTLTVTANGAPMPVLYPTATSKRDPLEPALTVDLYEGRTPLFVPLSSSEPTLIQARLEGLLCSDTTCQPLRIDFAVNATREQLVSAPLAGVQDWWSAFQSATPGLPEEQIASATSSSASEQSRGFDFSPRYLAPGLEVHTLSKAAFLAFLAGLILNFMPCVLPVITLKLRSFIPAADSVSTHQRKAFREHNLFFAIGVVLYFLLLSVAIAVTGMAWGQIFQQPEAIITLAAVVFALSLSLFGVYDLPLIDLKGKARGIAHHPRLESLSTGVLATILATPCSGPFLGGVLAWALIQPPRIIAVVLSCIGLGMASPYLLMAVFPGLYRFLPRPGTWTTHLERLLGFLLAGTTIYLIGLLPTTQYLNVLILLWLLTVCAWVWGQWTSLTQSRMRRWSIRGGVLAVLAISTLFLFRPEQNQDVWQPFDLAAFESQLGKKNMVLDFTADWCPNCKFLEKTVLAPDRSARLAQEFQVDLVRVDLTRHDPVLMSLLESLGSKSIPVLAIFSKDNPRRPLVLRDLFTHDQLREALESEIR